MLDVITCPGCQRRLALPGECRDRPVQCPACKHEFQATPIPSPAPPPRPVELRPATEPPRRSTPSRRPATARAKPAMPKRRKVLLAAALVAGVLAVPLGIWFLLYQGQSGPPHPRRFAKVPFDPVRRPPDQPADAELIRELKPLFDGLGQALRAGDADALLAHFDPDRALDELPALGISLFDPQQDHDALVRRLRDGMAAEFRRADAWRDGAWPEWTGAEIKHVHWLAGGDVEVLVRHRTPTAGVLTMRWWLTQHDDGWRVFDFEDLDLWPRFSIVAAGHAGGKLANGDGLQPVLAGLHAARTAIVRKDDPATAARKLQEIERIDLPPRLDALRQLVIARVNIQHNQFQSALRDVEFARGLQSDMPIAELLLGFVHNRLGNWETGLKHVQAYQALLGDDGPGCREQGLSLQGMRRFVEACTAYRTSLDHDPHNTEAFLGLLRSLAPADPHAELGARFAKLANPRASFDLALHECIQVRDSASLEPIAGAMLKLEPGYAPAHHGSAMVHAWAGRGNEAVTAFRAALAAEKDADKRRSYTSVFLPAMASTGLARQAYAAAPEPREAFRLIAAQLQRSFRLDELRPLIAAHVRKDPRDPLLPFYRAEVAVQDGAYARADKAFAAGMAQPPDAVTLDTFRQSRVLARYHTGHVLDALATIGPRRQTFEQLAQLCLQERNHALLAALLDAQQRADPEDTNLPRYGYLLKLRENDVAGAVALFQETLAKIPPAPAPMIPALPAGPAPDPRKQLVSSFLMDMIDEGQTVAGYQAAPDPQEAFSVLAEDLLDQGLFDELRRLIAAHRRRRPGDDRLLLYEGVAHLHERAWQNAVRAFEGVWPRAGDNDRKRFRYDYVTALYRSGRALQAYQQIGPQAETFRQVAGMFAHDKNGMALLNLVDVHRGNGGDAAELAAFEARAKVFNGQPAFAATQLQLAYRLQGNPTLAGNYVRDFVGDMDDAGHGLAAYRAAPDKAIAFETLAGRYTRAKNAPMLEALLAERGKWQLQDWWHHFYRGELALLRGQVAQAEQSFATALIGVPPAQQWLFRDGLRRAQLRAGKVAEAYQQAGGSRTAFIDLANLCVQGKNADNLVALLAARRAADPEAPPLPAWELEVKWLRHDYAGALAVIEAQGKPPINEGPYSLKFDSYRVRCLVKLKRHPDAIRAAEALTRANRFNGRLLLVLAHAAAGDAQQAIAALEQSRSPSSLRANCYQDPDLGPILRSDALQAFRQRFPEPKKEAGNEGW